MDDRKETRLSLGDVVRLLTAGEELVGPEMVVSGVYTGDELQRYELSWWDVQRHQFSSTVLPGCVLRPVLGRQKTVAGGCKALTLSAQQVDLLSYLLKTFNAHSRYDCYDLPDVLRCLPANEQTVLVKTMAQLGLSTAACDKLSADATAGRRPDPA